jgi:hypothetical protein
MTIDPILQHKYSSNNKGRGDYNKQARAPFLIRGDLGGHGVRHTCAPSDLRH